MDRRQANAVQYVNTQAVLVAGTSFAFLPAAENQNGRLLAGVNGWERAGGVGFTPLSLLCTGPKSPTSLEEAARYMIALTNDSFIVSYAAGAITDLGAKMQYEPAEPYFILPGHGVFLYCATSQASMVYTARLFFDLEQSGR